MNSDCTKPSVAPKPRFVCHARLKLPAPLISAVRGPKPSIAPKPKVGVEVNGRDYLLSGSEEGCSNGSFATSDGEPDEETDNALHRLTAHGLLADKQSRVLESPQKHLQNVSEGQDDIDVTEEEKEEEVSHKMDEDWRLTDSALTEEVDSVETLWASDAGLTGGSEDAVEMIDTDMTEDMDDDAGEALADTDGLSMGDISVDSVDEEVGDMKKTLRMKETVGGTESLTDDVLTSENMQDAGTQRVFLTLAEEREEEAECRIPCDILKSRCGHKMKEKERNIQPYSVTNEQMIRSDDFIPKDHLCNTHVTVENSPTREPHYIATEDIINRDMIQKMNKAHVCPLTPQRLLSLTTGGFLVRDRQTAGGTMSKDGPMTIDHGDECGSNISDDNKLRTRQEMEPVRAEEGGVEASCSRLSCQSRFRLACSSVSVDTDALLTSLSDDQLTPSSSDFLKGLDDLEGQFVAFVDDTTDTEQDVSEEHVYEDPGHCSDGENVFPFNNKRTQGARSCSLSQHRNHAGVQFVGRPGMNRCEKGPALSSSPLLSYSKPQYLSLYPRSLSSEGRDSPLCVYRDSEGSPRQRGATSSSGRFSRCSPLSSSGLSTPTSVVDIPPPFELAYITKKPITKSSPSLLIEGDSSEKNRKKKSSIKRFLMLKFRRKKDNKPLVDSNPSSFKSSPQSSLHAAAQILDIDRHSIIRSSPRLKSHSASTPPTSSEPASAFLFYPESQRQGSSVAFLNRSVIRVESFEDRSRVAFTPLPLTKPRSISFPNADTSDYENVPPVQSHYENLQVLQRRPVRQEPFRDFFERPTQVVSSASETDGYVDMSSLPGFQSRCQASEQEAESAYTEAYNVCVVATAPPTGSVCDVRGQTAAHEDQGRTSEEDDGGGDNNYDRRPEGQSRAFYIAKELVDTEKLHVKALKHLQEDFRAAVGAAVGDQGEPVVDEERLWEILNELPDVYSLHCRILAELENRIQQWEDSQRIADVFLSRKAEFLVFTTYIGHYDRSMSMLEESCRTSPAFAAVVHQFEQRPAGNKVSLKHQLLQVIVRVAQYRMLLTDYLNNLSPDSQEYEDTQAAVVIVSDIADQANDSLRHGENLLRLVNIEYSVRGQRDLLQPGRVFVKEGTLMKVSRKCRQPRHLFLMNDVLLYTYPQQDGKYRWKNTLALTGLKVSKPIIDDVQHALRIEGADISITLSASSFLEREDWFYTLSRTVTEHSRGSVGFSSSTAEARDRLQFSLGEKAPTLVPVSQVMMCMNCTSDFSLTLRKHHCHGCGRIVCRSCSQNRFPLKYMKGRTAKVCDHCYNELKKRGEDVSGLSHKNSPRLTRSTRPLSAVFQNIHPPNIWRHRKGAMSFSQVTESDEGSISGSLHRSKKSKRSWKRLWFLLKDKVLYTYRAQEEKVASESLPLLGFTVKLSDKQEGEEAASVFQLYHKNTLYYTFKAEDNHTAQRWVNAMEEATVL